MQRDATPVKIEAQEFRDSFACYGFIMSRDGQVEEDVEHRTRVEWLKWRLAPRVLCDCRLAHTNIKGKLYKIAIGLAMTHRVECWPIRKQQMQKMSVAEITTLR